MYIVIIVPLLLLGDVLAYMMLDVIMN